jgi:hypothetical protein
MGYMIEDTYVEPNNPREEASEATKGDLRVYIRQFVRGAGGKAENHVVYHACMTQFPGAFSPDEVKAQMARVQAKWDADRALAEAAANPPVEP